MQIKRTLTIDNLQLNMPAATEMDVEWIGQEEVIKQLLASWMVLDEKDLPLNPRIVGKPGMGKTTCAYAAAKRMTKHVYLFQATMDTRPEDLIVMPVIGPNQQIQYMTSTIVAAAVNGGVCVLDEGNRMNERSWASLAPLLDHRRYLESVVTGIKIPAHPHFRFVTTMNEDASTYDLPEYIHSRLQPQIFIDFPEGEEERAILKANVPFVDDEILAYVLSFLASAHKTDQRYTVRDGINIVRYAMKWLEQEGGERRDVFEKALLMILGEEALPHVSY